ncbi:hypothetical protein PIB30_037263 [Stylosanthes scabra]|uniref:Uncharacterized protein n=1 Tax=Stylosanthes scabra TaxID=79078 RepID=A0ABU6TEQ3_9FABA|nr:hypothetical protein [Stylosanthes scabra]
MPLLLGIQQLMASHTLVSSSLSSSSLRFTNSMPIKCFPSSFTVTPLLTTKDFSFLSLSASTTTTPPPAKSFLQESPLNEIEKSSPDMLHEDSVVTHAKEAPWIEVQKKEKKKSSQLNGAHLGKKPILGNAPSRVPSGVGQNRSSKPKSSYASGAGSVVMKPSSAAASSSTPASLHPHKRRQPPSLQSSSTKKVLSEGDGISNTEAVLVSQADVRNLEHGKSAGST